MCNLFGLQSKRRLLFVFQVIQIVSQLRRERNEASLRRRSEVAELQRAAATRTKSESGGGVAALTATGQESPRDDVFIATIARLKAQVEVTTDAF